MKDKLISAEALNKSIRDDASIDGRNYARMKMHINEAQAVDAVEVVRCKDCKIAFNNPFLADYPQLVCRNGVNWRVVESKHFCSYGERKEDGK